MNLKGDFAALAKLQQRIKQLASPAVRKQLAQAIGAEAVTQVHAGFRGSRDPYDREWAPLKHRNGEPLLHTGRMRSSFTFKATATGFELGSNVVYTKFHQYGTNGRKKASSQRRFTNKRGRLIRRERAFAMAEKASARLSKVNAAVKELEALDPKLARKFRGKQKSLGHAAALHFRTFNFSAGGGKIPQRMMVPEGSLGPLWSAAFGDTGRRFFRKIMKK